MTFTHINMERIMNRTYMDDQLKRPILVKRNKVFYYFFKKKLHFFKNISVFY